MYYRSLNAYLRETFGCKVYKLALSAGCTCPNRDGTIGTRGCIFCSGSGEFAASASLSIPEQLAQAKRLVAAKAGPDARYIAYFQDFTNTYAPAEVLRPLFAAAIRQPEVCALSIATRPDCLPPEILSLLLNSLYALDTLQKPQSIVKAAFELKLLALSGYEPLLDGCAVCGTHNPKEPVFDAQQGVLLCKECADHGGGGLLPLDAGSFAAMRHVLFSEPKRMLSFSLSGETEKRFAAACEVFAQVQLDRRFKTLDFYKSMKIDN